MPPSLVGNRELARLLKDIPTEKPVVEPEESPPLFKRRDEPGQAAILFDLFNAGVDIEDLRYLRLCYDKMLSSDDVVSLCQC